MALIVCEECKKEFSNTLDACPHCGYKLKKLSIGEIIVNHIIEKIKKEGRGFADINLYRELYTEYAKECDINPNDIYYSTFEDINKELEKYQEPTGGLLGDACSIGNYKRIICDKEYYDNMIKSNEIYTKHNIRENIKVTTDILIRDSVYLFLDGSKYKTLEKLRNFITDVIILHYGEEFDKEEIVILCTRYINRFNYKIFTIDKNDNIKKYDFIKEHNIKSTDHLGINNNFIYDILDTLVEGSNNFRRGLYVSAYLEILIKFNVIDKEKQLNNDFINNAKKDFITTCNKLCEDKKCACLYDIYILLKKYELSILILISKMLIKENKILIDTVTNGLNYRIFNIEDKSKLIGDYISFYIKNNDYIDLKYIRLIIKETSDYSDENIVKSISDKKNLIVKDNVIFDKDNTIPSIYKRMYTYFFKDITNYINIKRGATYIDIINEIGLKDENETREFFNYLLDNNYIKNEPYLSSDIYFNINDYVQDPRINKFNEAGILKSMYNAISKYKDMISKEDKEKLLELETRYATNYNKLASAIITSPSISYMPSSVLTSEVIGTAIGGATFGYLMGKEQEKKLKNYYDSIGKNAAWTKKIHELRKSVYYDYYEVESTLCKYKNIREDLEKTKQEIIDKHKQESNAKKGCYVATCVYGSYDCPEVWTLRRYRDYSLANSLLGRMFIKIYYFTSPTIVKLFGNTKLFKNIVKKKLDKMVKKLNADGYCNTPYDDIKWK